MSQYRNYKWYRFWIRTSRGTDTDTYRFLPGDWEEDDLKADLDEWAQKLGARNSTRGYEDIDAPPPKILQSKIDEIKGILKEYHELIVIWEIQQLQKVT